MTQLFDTRPRGIVGYAQVALEQGIDISPAGLTYAVPSHLGDLVVGDRVIVPLGKNDKPVAGHVVQRQETSDLGRVKTIVSRDAHGISLTADLVDLARWMAGYYCCPLGLVLVAMLPAAVKRGTGTYQQSIVRFAEGEPDAAAPKLSALQGAVLDAARQRAATEEPWAEMKELADAAGARSVSPVKQLLQKGLLLGRTRPAVRAAPRCASGGREPDPQNMVLTEAQQRAIDHVIDALARGFSVHLLHGVTGSGKTEVYLRVIAHVLEQPAPLSAVVLVPEISLTPQMERRFVARFDRIAVLHSGLTSAQRHDHWRRIREGKARVVVGARSAVFAPFPPPGPGIIVVDEEHDSSYKQDQVPRYHGRDVAIKRAQVLGVPVLLGSGTPSLESYYNATESGGSKVEGHRSKVEASAAGGARDLPQHRPRYRLLELPERVAGLKPPKVQIVDMVQERRKRYQMTGRGGVHLLSIALEQQLRQTVEAGGQVILLLNRRGYANYIACPDHGCGWIMNCEFCDTTVVYHKDRLTSAGGFVRCHHCQAEQMLPPLCPVCSKKVTVFGLGTQRVEEELGRKFPNVSVLRMDSDTMQSSRDYNDGLDAFGEGKVKVLLGTQVIAKGLDFPNVRLVGVISADTALHMPDFRAAERTFQLVSQVAGRAGRGAHPGTVVVQTFSPEDPAIVLASRHDYCEFARREIQQRRQCGLPPVTRMARIVVRDQDFAQCVEHARALGGHLEQGAQRLGGHVQVRGPMPCPIARIAGFHRQQVELVAPGAGQVQQLLTALRNARLLRSDRQTAVDVDPVVLL